MQFLRNSALANRRSVLKKILIFTSNGGAGHMQVTRAVKAYLGQGSYQITSITFMSVLQGIDPVARIMGKSYSGDDLWNYLLRQRQYTLLNFIYRAGRHYFSFFVSYIEKKLGQYIADTKPDLIISVSPLINGALQKVSSEQKIPFLIIPTDLDPRTFLLHIDPTKTEHMAIAVPYDHPDIMHFYQNANIPTRTCKITGFGVRPEFLQSYNTHALKQKYNIPQDRPSVCIMLGGQGSKSMIPIVQALCSVQQPLHMILCIGKFKELEPTLQQILSTFPDHKSGTIVSYIPEVADYMAAADFLILKSGSVSVNEAIYLNKPMILEGMFNKILIWEQFNHNFITKHHFGFSCKNISQLQTQVNQLLTNPELLQFQQDNLRNFTKPNPAHNITQLIQHMLS